MKPYYQDNSVTIYHGDCREVLPAVGKVDLVVTSPPYDGLRDYGGHAFDFQAMVQPLVHSLGQGAALVWVVGDETKHGTESGSSFKQALRFMELGLKLHDTMIFEKHNFSNPSHNRYHQLFEYMFVFCRGKIKTVNIIKDKKNKYSTVWGRNNFREKDGTMKERKAVPYKEFGARGNIWKYLVGNINGDWEGVPEHPAVFPVLLAKDHISSWSNPGDTVLDPFMGSGTTLLAAKRLDRQAIGIEIEERYCEIAAKRMAQQTINLGVK